MADLKTISQLNKPKYKSGDIYNELTLTGKSFVNGRRYLEFICVCGKSHFSLMSNILSGKTKSCGCKRYELSSIKLTTHGMGKKGTIHPIYNTYNCMKNRCYNVNYDRYEDWGGRGITVCDEWLNDIHKFIEWAINNGWRKGLTLDRIDNNGNYAPENCKWSDNYEQGKNKRNSYIIEAFGEKKILSEWARDSRSVVSAEGIKKRIEIYGWDAERAISDLGRYHKNPKKILSL